MNYEGIMTALITPIDEDGRVDELSLRELIRFQLKNEVQSLLILGGTGEYAALSNYERKRAVDIAVNEVNGKVPVVVGILSTGLGDAIEMSLCAKASGAAAIMVVTPYYVLPGQQGIIDYYKKLDKAVDMPILLYNIPYRTGVNMLPETVEKMVDEMPNIVGIKECAPNLGQAIELLKRVGNRIDVLCGEEFFVIAELIYGAKGLVMASANIIPDVWIKIYNLVKNGDIKEAAKLHTEYYPLFKAIFMETNPGPLKEAVKMIGLPAGVVSTPLVAPNDTTMKVLRETMKEFNLIK